MEESPHRDCPNYLEEFTKEERAQNCVTCFALGTTCRGLKHTRQKSSLLSSNNYLFKMKFYLPI